jgi:hypothetical protein
METVREEHPKGFTVFKGKRGTGPPREVSNWDGRLADPELDHFCNVTHKRPFYRTPWRAAHGFVRSWKRHQGRLALLRFPRGKREAAKEQRRSEKQAAAVGRQDTEAGRLLAAYKPKTFGQIAKATGELRHLWLNWLVLGNVSMVYSKPKIGKTRFYIALIKHLWFASQWPDGASNDWPAGTKTLIIPYDRNHAEIAAEMKLLGIPDQAAVCPSDPRDPTGLSLLSLNDLLMEKVLSKTLADDKRIRLIVIDTLTYASEKSLCKPEDMKAILDGVMVLAAQYAVAVLALIHENREGKALGRRICERARVLMRLERYSETDATRLRLFVEESNFKDRPALTVIHTDAGVVFEAVEASPRVASDRRNSCARWIMDFFFGLNGIGTEVDFATLIDAAGKAGFAGSFNSIENRWSDRQLLSRAIKAINEKDPAIADLHVFRLAREERPRPGRSKPLIVYRLESA